MPIEMKPVERVRASLRHSEPDRVPTALWGGPYGIVDEVYLMMVEAWGLGQLVAPFRRGHNISYMDDRVLDLLGTDTRYVWPGESPSSPNRPTGEKNKWLDGYGQTWEYHAPYYFQGKPLLSEASIDDIDNLFRMPDVNDPRWNHGVRERAQALREGTDAYVIARMVTSHGPYMTASHLRGVEQFFIDMGENPDFVLALLERVTEMLAVFLKNYLEAAGPYIDMMELPGDDYATSKGMAFSPRMFRKYFKPCVKRLVDIVKSYREDIQVMAHCDGALEPILPDLVEIGVDVIHPLEPLPSVDQAAIKARFAGQLSFLGGIDIVHALPGTQQDVIREVKRRISQFAPGGGYILAPANHIQADVPLENLTALFAAAKEYGSYPIDLARLKED